MSTHSKGLGIVMQMVTLLSLFISARDRGPSDMLALVGGCKNEWGKHFFYLHAKIQISAPHRMSSLLYATGGAQINHKLN